ncbi:hypothetical protein [Halobaculum rubrum]|uniref:hypothetical protein n=1 Tax=Halobaculum rubrum TaxID=2872158 RepID=UPI001CA3FC53|nr:hypothetical protein [Halobaculum rubrum]QZX99636.1 hypothetical protein K6T25_00565 [Halobaculum rubrum]
MRRRSVVAALAAAFSSGSLPGDALAHPSHSTATPTGPLAGASPTGLGIGLAGVLLISGALLLARDGTFTGRTRTAGVGIGAALTVIGAVVAFVHF